MKKFIPNPGGQFFNPVTNKIFIPTGKPKFHDRKSKTLLVNPAVWKSWGLPTYGKLFVGLSVQDPTGKTIEVLTEKIIRDAVRAMRGAQIGEEYGSTFISQTGHWHDPATGTFIEEPSLQIIIYPSPEEPFDVFKENMRKLCQGLLKYYHQKSVLYEFAREGQIVDSGEIVLE